MSMENTGGPSVDLGALKVQQQSAWTDGDYGRIGVTLQPVGETLAETLALRPGEAVLDVAAGNGNFSLAAARRHARTTSIDFVSRLLSQGRARAEAEGLKIRFRLADAEDLPFADRSFDVTGSVFGVMFTTDPRRAASELLRVTRPGGRIGLANWTPDSFVGRLFETIGRHVPPPPLLPSPSAWGIRERLDELFGASSRSIEIRPRCFVFRDHSPAVWIERFRRDYGPMKRAFESLEPETSREFAEDIEALIAGFDRGDGVMVVPSAYVEVVATLR